MEINTPLTVTRPMLYSPSAGRDESINCWRSIGCLLKDFLDLPVVTLEYSRVLWRLNDEYVFCCDPPATIINRATGKLLSEEQFKSNERPRNVDALKLSRASGIAIEKFAGEIINTERSQEK
jgi:hypothetical protein